MNQEIKDKWLCSLVSGAYPKGKNALCTEENGKRAYCCLGVLADILGTQWKKRFEERSELTSVTDDSLSYLCEDTLDQIGLPMEDSFALALLNDESDSFAPVIDYIREKL